MTEPLTAALQDLLRDCAARETHLDTCDLESGMTTYCTCGRSERVLARQARGMELFAREIARVAFTLGWTGDPWADKMPTPAEEAEINEQAFETGLAAGRAALEEP